MAGTGLALAAVGFVGVFMWRLGQARVWAVYTASMVSPGGRLLQSWYLTLVDLRLQISAGGFVITTPEGHQSQLLAFPRWRQSQGQC